MSVYIHERSINRTFRLFIACVNCVLFCNVCVYMDVYVLCKYDVVHRANVCSLSDFRRVARCMEEARVKYLVEFMRRKRHRTVKYRV